MNSHSFRVVLVLVVTVVVALYLGVAAATAQFEAIAWVMAGVATIVLFGLGRHVWILIPIALGFDGNINALPGSPPTWALAGAAAGAMLVLRFFVRRTGELCFRFTLLDFAVLLQVLVLAQAFVRNPTGLMLLGGDLVGGKPYFVFAAAIVCYSLLAVVRTNFKMFRLSLLGYLACWIVDGIIRILSQLIPGLGVRVLSLYSGVSARTALGGELFEAETGRLEGARRLGPALVTAAFGLFRPITAALPSKIAPFLLAGLGLGLVLLSGYRSMMILCLFLYIAGALVRRNGIDIVIASLLGALGLAALLASGAVRELPHGGQRILSVLPFADVDPNIRAAAKGSAEGRFEMWRLALFTDRYIQNKWLGDGFAYRADEQRAKMEIAFGGAKRFSRGMGFIESSLASGSYHGFHVETIRFTGIFGLAAAIFLMFVCVRAAWRLARHYRGRPGFGYAAFLALPFLIYPFQSLLVFGAYRAEFPQFIVLAGMLKVLDNIRVMEWSEAAAGAKSDESVVPVRRTVSSS